MPNKLAAAIAQPHVLDLAKLAAQLIYLQYKEGEMEVAPEDALDIAEQLIYQAKSRLEEEE